MYEIYYTSAPEGLKPGTRGFCTVAATAGIPRALWERLETLSAYRHQVQPGQPGVNPISYAHWLLHVAGREYHVLSRIADAGMDYTRRPHTFAHHVALEPHELPPAGPAALLQQPGFMQERWGGVVGAIPARQVAGAEERGRVPATRWAQCTGDAGYAGWLAESFLRIPPRPVCVQFALGQDMLPLMGEAMGLLPAALRWQVTFNTYFTSMPPSASCLWRCCLAGTPAALAGTRYAASNILLDLTLREKLPALPVSPWVTYARGGPAPAVAPARPVPAPPTPPERSVRAPAPSAAPAGVPLPPVPDLEAIGALSVEPASTGRSLTPGLLQVSPDAATVDMPAKEGENEEKRSGWGGTWPWIVGVAIGIGAGWMVLRGLTPPPEAAKAPVAERQAESPASEMPAADEEKSTAVATAPVAAATATKAQPVAPTSATAPTLPSVLTFKENLESPTKQAVTVRDKTQTLALPPAEATRLAQTKTLRLLFPGDKETFEYQDEELQGVFSSAPEARPGQAGVSLLWKASLDPGAASEVAVLRYTPGKGSLDILWRSRMLSDPERVKVAELAYWVLQNGSLRPEGREGELPRVNFASSAPRVLSLLEAAQPLGLPSAMPASAQVEVAGGVPAGWTAQVTSESDVKDPAQRTKANSYPVLYVYRPTQPGEPLRGWFSLKFKERLGSVESDFARNRQANEARLAETQKALTGIESQIKHLTDEATGEMGVMDEAGRQRRRAKLEAELAEPQRSRTELTAKLAAAMATQEDYRQIKEIEITVELPGRLWAGTWRFTASEPPAGAGTGR